MRTRSTRPRRSSQRFWAARAQLTSTSQTPEEDRTCSPPPPTPTPVHPSRRNRPDSVIVEEPAESEVPAEEPPADGQPAEGDARPVSASASTESPSRDRSRRSRQAPPSRRPSVCPPRSRWSRRLPPCIRPLPPCWTPCSAPAAATMLPALKMMQHN